jgi:hypothetical protein
MSRFITRRLIGWQDDNGNDGWIRPGMKQWDTANAVVDSGHDLVDHATCDLSLPGELRALGALAFRIVNGNRIGYPVAYSSSYDIVAREVSDAYHNAYMDLMADYSCKLLVTPKLSHWHADYLHTIRQEADHQFTRWEWEYGDDFPPEEVPKEMDDAAFSHLVYGFAWAQKRYKEPHVAEMLVEAARKVCEQAWKIAEDDGESRMTVILDTEHGSVEGLLRHGYRETTRYVY